MKSYLLTISALITSIGFAQITITDADIASPGDTAIVSFSDETSIDFLSTGADFSWDFSALNISAQSIDTFNSVSSADVLFQLIYNNGISYPEHVSDWYNDWDGGGLTILSQYGVDIEEPVQFTKVSSSSVENTGFGFYVQGTAVPAKSDTLDVQYELPMNYLDSWTSDSYTYLNLNPTFDAIWIRYQTRISEVDGWGQITTPFGTFDAIRVKSSVTAMDSLWAGMLGSWFELPNPDQVQYEWFTNGQKLPIFSIITNDVGGNEVVSEIKFKDKKRYFASIEEQDFEGKVYPNPASQQLTIELTEQPQLIELIDMSGRVVKTIVPEGKITQLDVSDLENGIYLIQLHNSAGTSSRKLIID